MKELTYSIGQYFKYDEGELKSVYLLSRIDNNTVCLISIFGGNRYTKPIKVGNCFEITSFEMNTVMADDTEYFTPITKQQAAELLLTSNKTD